LLDAFDGGVMGRAMGSVMDGEVLGLGGEKGLRRRAPF
jgi:hypothetical protein